MAVKKVRINKNLKELIQMNWNKKSTISVEQFLIERDAAPRNIFPFTKD